MYLIHFVHKRFDFVHSWKKDGSCCRNETKLLYLSRIKTRGPIPSAQNNISNESSRMQSAYLGPSSNILRELLPEPGVEALFFVDILSIFILNYNRFSREKFEPAPGFNFLLKI